MDKSPSTTGAKAEREVAHVLGSAGWEVYVPLFVPDARADLVAVRDGQVLRIQVKSGVVRHGCVYFPTCSNTANARRNYRGEVDAFGVYCAALDRVYLVPADGLGERGCSLRVDPPANGQSKGVRFAADFELRRRC